MSLSIPVEAKRLPSRCLVFTTCLFGAFIFWTYNAGLVSHLTVDKIEWPIKSLQDVVNDNSYRYTYELFILFHDQIAKQNYKVMGKNFEK